MSSPFISIPCSSPVSGRARDYLGELNRVVADPNLGASLEQIEEGVKEYAARGAGAFLDDDLVARLISDNRVLWNQLLNNPFCTKMKTASKDDQAVLEGFEWYMRQDFLYCIKLITYEATRAPKALNSKDFSESAQRVKDNADYATTILTTCTTQPPDGLGILDANVLGTPETGALKTYTDYQISIANTTNWVVGLVAMIPCIQSYYQIAVKLKDTSTHTDTPWYKLWVLENAKYGDYTAAQRNFFIQNVNQWRNSYDKANEVFQRACQGEIDLWATALKPGVR